MIHGIEETLHRRIAEQLMVRVHRRQPRSQILAERVVVPAGDADVLRHSPPVLERCAIRAGGELVVDADECGCRTILAGHFDHAEDGVAVSHLSAVFGLVEVLSEILDLLDLPEFEEEWLRYCRLYLATEEEQEAEVSATWNPALRQAHTRLRAWASQRTDDDDLAEAAWRDFLWGTADRWNLQELDPTEAIPLIDDLRVAEPVGAISRFTTNDGAQFGLAAIQNLALIRTALDAVVENGPLQGSL